MKDRELSEKLKQDARNCGLCDEWYNGWGEPDKDSLILKYKKGIDFQILTHFVSDRDILKNFPSELLRAHHVYVDDDVIEKCVSDVYIVQGDSDCIFNISDYSVVTFHIFGNAKVRINASGISRVFVNVYEYADANVCQEQYSKAYVYTHGGHCTASSKGDVMFRKSNILA